MEKIKVKIMVLEGVDLPYYETFGAAGFDLKANSFQKIYKGIKEIDLTKELQNSIANGCIMLRPFERMLVGTGMFVELPAGTELQIRSRSGACLKKGLVVLNAPGTIDSDYRGEIGVVLYNSSQFLCEVKIGERIAQAVFTEHAIAQFEQVSELSDTQRGAGGYGSTGA